ncbi:MAG: flippase-like domain-containing protein [Pseudorhodoplanes sp.]|nr:MAG: flippase-like domain-containing protein [Pseudorhodoplanes sp.]
MTNVNPKKYIQILLSALLLFSAFAFVFAGTDSKSLRETMTAIPIHALFFVIVIMVGGVILAAARFMLIARDLGYALQFHNAIRIFALSQLAGVIFFQLPGQLIARSALLSRQAIPVSGTILITGYERLCSAFVSLFLAAGAAIYLFGQIRIDLGAGGTAFVKIVAGLVAAIVGGALVGWGRKAVDLIPLITNVDIKSVLRTLILSLLIQLSTMIGYIILARATAGEISIWSLAAASCLVMLAASLPISFSGWGIRELSAIMALGAIGVSAHESFIVALLMGIISLFAIACLLPFVIGVRNLEVANANKAEASKSLLPDYSAMLGIALPLAAATAVFFQIFMPLNRGLLNVNLADPIAVLGGSFFVVQHFKKGWPDWRYRGFNRFIFLVTLTVLFGYLHGLVSFGWSDWAFSNKLIGWLVLLSYGATGALIVRQVGGEGFDLLLKTFVGVAASIVIFELCILFAYRAGAHSLASVFYLPLQGLSQNRNAFALLLLLALAGLIVSRWLQRDILAGIILIGIWYAASRSVFFALPFVLLIAQYVKIISWLFVVRSIAIASLLLFVTTAGPILINLLASTSGSSLYEMIRPIVTGTDSERMTSIVGGFNLFIQHPFFGAGLGAYYEQQAAAGHPLVIHSVPVWLLAEFGIIGAVIIASPIFFIFFSEVCQKTYGTRGAFLVLIITGFAVMSVFHEIMYQRGFWILLGAAVACQKAVWGEQRSGSVA